MSTLHELESFIQFSRALLDDRNCGAPTRDVDELIEELRSELGR